MKIYTVFDDVAQEHSPVFECKNDDVARRYFKGVLEKSPDPENLHLFVHGYVHRQDKEIKIVPGNAMREVEMPNKALSDGEAQ